MDNMKARKLYKCSNCDREVPILSKGMCPLCRSKSLPPKERKPLKCKPKKKSTNYSDFYSQCLTELYTIKMSEYSGRSILYPTVCNVCHILPKRIYKSVAEDRENIIFLTNEEHDKLDRYLDSMDMEGLKKDMNKLYLIVLSRVCGMLLEDKVKERGRLIYAIEKEIESYKGE